MTRLELVQRLYAEQAHRARNLRAENLDGAVDALAATTITPIGRQRACASTKKTATLDRRNRDGADCKNDAQYL